MSKFLKFIVNVFLIFAIAVACAILLPTMFGVTTVIVDSASMDTNLPYGSITYSHDVAIADLKAGDEILKDTDSSTYAYVIQSIGADGKSATVVNAVDESAEPEDMSLGASASKVAVMIPYIGYVLIAMHSTQGIIIIALVVALMIILFILSELWKEKPEDEETDDEKKAAGEGAEASEPLNVNVEIPPIEGASEIVVPEPETGEMEEDTTPVIANEKNAQEMQTEEAIHDATLTVPDGQDAGTESAHTGMTIDMPDLSSSDDAGNESLELNVPVTAADDTTEGTKDLTLNVKEPSETEEKKKDLTLEVQEEIPEREESEGSPSIIVETKEPEAGGEEDLLQVPQFMQEEKTSQEEEEVPAVEAPVRESEEVAAPSGGEDTVDEEIPVIPDTAPEEKEAESSEPARIHIEMEDAGVAQTEEEEPDHFTPVNRGTLDEILDQAARDDIKPEVSLDEPTGITLVDYSKAI
ncbi:MAG: hypothetical protein VZR02_00180 [Lachnospiraceae bacterium]|nr:hypothetical protein [Lachnospiraceae bacterium]